MAGHAIYEAACEAFGEDAVRHSYYPAKDGAVDFPVLVGEQSEAASSMLEAVTTVPPTKFDAVFVDPIQFEAAKRWLYEKKTSELQARKAGENDEEAEKSDAS